MAKHPGNAKSLEPYLLKTDRDEPLIYKLQVRIPKSLYDELNTLEDKNEFIRTVIKEALDKRKNSDRSQD